MGNKESRTEKTTNFVERIAGGDHYKTTIHDGVKRATGEAKDAETSQKIAKDKWVKGETSNIGCFITTACVESRGLPDDCEELNCLRKFRDEFVSIFPNGNELVKEYYEKAPLVVSAINKTKNPKEIYATLFEELVSGTVHLIKSGKKQEALGNCVSIIRELERKYLR